MSSNLSKKTINPNPSPTGKIWFGLYWFGAGDRTRTGTLSPAADFESATSTISSHRQVCSFNFFAPLRIYRIALRECRCPVAGSEIFCSLCSRNFDRCPSLGSLLPPPAALPSLPRLSPDRHRWRRILSPLRLPFHHTGRC